MLFAPGYRRSIGVRRMRCHAKTARAFRELSSSEPVPDAVLVSYPTIELSREAVRYGKRHGVPVAVDVRDLWPDLFTDVFPGFLGPAVRLLCRPLDATAREVFEGADRIVGITDEFVEWGLRKGGRGKSDQHRAFAMGYQRPVGIGEVAAEDMEFWTKQGIDPSDWVICFFGTLGKQFALSATIEAARILEERLPRVRIVVCGDGDEAGRYRDQARGLRNLLFPGWVNRNQISALMRLSRAGLAPYRNTTNFLLNLPNKPIEYLSAGLPVIATIDGVLGRLIEQHDVGVVSAENDPQALASSIEHLYNAPQRLAAMSRNAQALYDQQFEAGHVYSEFSDYLVEMASAARA